MRAGLELIAAVAGLKTCAALQTRIGIATGLVVVGDLIGSGAAQEQAIVGEAPNLAARLHPRRVPPENLTGQTPLKRAITYRSRRQRKTFELSIQLSIGTFSSVPFPRSEAYRAKGNHMRTLVQPPPSSQCHFCGGELRLKQIESASRILELDNEIFVCAKCGREQSYTVSHDHMIPDPKAA